MQSSHQMQGPCIQSSQHWQPPPSPWPTSATAASLGQSQAPAWMQEQSGSSQHTFSQMEPSHHTTLQFDPAQPSGSGHRGSPTSWNTLAKTTSDHVTVKRGPSSSNSAPASVGTVGIAASTWAILKWLQLPVLSSVCPLLEDVSAKLATPAKHADEKDKTTNYAQVE